MLLRLTARSTHNCEIMVPQYSLSGSGADTVAAAASAVNASEEGDSSGAKMRTCSEREKFSEAQSDHTCGSGFRVWKGTLSTDEGE